MTILSTFSVQSPKFRSFVKDKDVNFIDLSRFAQPFDFVFPVGNENSKIKTEYSKELQEIFEADESKVFVITNIQNTLPEIQYLLSDIMISQEAKSNIKSNVVFLLDYCKDKEALPQPFMARMIPL